MLYVLKEFVLSVPRNYDELYSLWVDKIRSTVRNKTKISIHEIDDVVQIVFTAAFEKKWLSIYDGSNEFSTFFYTYALKEIQNYINKRDSQNVVHSSGCSRYTNFSSFSLEADSVSNFIDFVSFKKGNTTLIDETVDWENFCAIASERVVVNLFGDVSCLTIIETRLNVNLSGKYVPFSVETVPDEKYPTAAQVCSRLGISASDLANIDHCLALLLSGKFEDAIDYLETTFML